MEGSGVRKGAWSRAEDDLLRACVERYGEGKWHLVPIRAGLNRCRKSCRLRWLNYLKPNIKRGEFSEDEVDLMRRLHTLLGNRWSLIAGRLPGRTPNDVKNFWNTYVRNARKANNKPKEVLQHHTNNKKNNNNNNNNSNSNIAIIKAKEITSTNSGIRVKPHEVIRPQPRTFSRTSPWLRSTTTTSTTNDTGTTNTIVEACAKEGESKKKGGCWLGSDELGDKEEWGMGIMNSGGESDEALYSNFGEQDWKLLNDINWNWDDNNIKDSCHGDAADGDGCGVGVGGGLLIEGKSWNDILLDINLWDS